MDKRSLNEADYIDIHGDKIEMFLATQNMAIVAKKFGLSRERIRQICVKILGKDKMKELKEIKKAETQQKNNAIYIKKYGLRRYNTLALRKELKQEVKKGKRWSVLYSSCVVCGKTDNPYYSKGMCSLCYGRKRYEDPKYREKHSEYAKNWYDKNRAKKSELNLSRFIAKIT